MGRQSKYPPEMRERAVRLVFEQRDKHESSGRPSCRSRIKIRRALRVRRVVISTPTMMLPLASSAAEFAAVRRDEALLPARRRRKSWRTIRWAGRLCASPTGRCRSTRNRRDSRTQAVSARVHRRARDRGVGADSDRRQAPDPTPRVEAIGEHNRLELHPHESSPRRGPRNRVAAHRRA